MRIRNDMLLTKQTGELNHMAKLTFNDIHQIKVMYGNGISKKEIARKFKVSDTNIYLIIKNKIWKHVV